ncbi:hypothetical protein [Azospirillum sp. sgz301742]
MSTMSPAVTDAQHSIAHAERFRRLWRAVRVGMMVLLSVFLAILIVYTGIAIGTQAGAWHWGFLLVGDAFLVSLLVMVARHRGTERLFDADVASATQRLHAAGYRPVLRGGRVLVAPLNAPDDAAVEVEGA